MPKYEVKLHRTVIQKTTLIVGADSIREAEEEALHLANNADHGQIEWRFVSRSEEARVIRITTEF